MACPAGNKKCDASISNFSVEIKKKYCKSCNQVIAYYCSECEQEISRTTCGCEKNAGPRGK